MIRRRKFFSWLAVLGLSFTAAACATRERRGGGSYGSGPSGGGD